VLAFLPLTVLAFGVVDYGEVMAQATNLSAIVRGAAEYARGQVVQGNSMPTASQIGTVLNVPAAVFATSSFCTCADNSMPSPLPTCPTGGANPCAAKTDPRILQYVVVSGSQNYTPLISGTWSSSFPGSVKARTVIRTQ
jgi:Flp pilus assembly protein TadG